MQFVRDSCLRGNGIENSAFELSEVELAPGVVLERRMMLAGGIGLFTALFWPTKLRALGQEPALNKPSNLDADSNQLETLIALLRPEARRLIASEEPDEEKYILRAIEELERVSELETNRFTPSHKSGWEMDFQAYVPPLLLYQIRMSPNSVIDLHDHRHHNGALSVREGAVRVRSFDIFQDGSDTKWDVAAGNVPALGEDFLIQEKTEKTLKQGQAVGLTRTRDNIHQLEAGPNGCLMYDLFTNFKINAQSFEIK